MDGYRPCDSVLVTGAKKKAPIPLGALITCGDQSL